MKIEVLNANETRDVGLVQIESQSESLQLGLFTPSLLLEWCGKIIATFGNDPVYLALATSESDPNAKLLMALEEPDELLAVGVVSRTIMEEKE